MSSSPSLAASPSLKRRHAGHAYDVFISHAGPDKHTMAIPLHEKLKRVGITAFVDEIEMRYGCEAPPAMMKAMETAAIGVFILSIDFVARKWPVKELYCFLERVERAALQVGEKPVLIPVFYRLSTEQCHCIDSLQDEYEGGRNAFIDSRFFRRQRKGEPEADLDKLQLAFTKLVSHMGPRNLDNVTNENSNHMEEKRGRLVDEIVNSVITALEEKKEEEGNSRHASQSATDMALETKDSFKACFDLPLPGPNMVMSWECDSHGVPVTMEGKLKKAVMDSTQDRDASVVSAVDCYPIGACGHGGVGKTSALIGVGRENDVQEHFKDGVYFVRVGRDANDASMVGALAQLVRKCGGVQTCSLILDSKSVEGAVQMTGGYFRGKCALFMFDDLGPTEKSNVGYVKEIRQLVATCPESRILISTRSTDVAEAGSRRVQFEVRDAEGGVARDMLCRSAGIEQDRMGACENELGTVLRFCKGLPLTLQVAGCAIRKWRGGGMSLRGAIESFVNDLQAGITRPATETGEEYPSFHDTVAVSLRMADKWHQREESYRGEKGRTVSELYERLAVLGRQMHAPRSMLRVLWELETEKETEVVVKRLEDLNLVKRGMKGSEVGVEVHDLLLEYCEAAAGEKVKGYHGDVLSGYYKLKGEDTRRRGGSESGTGSGKSTDVGARVSWWWEDGLSRGYIGENVCRHLAGAGECEELAMLLTDARWALAQVRRGRVMGWMGDFDELFGAMQKQKTGGGNVSDLEKDRKGLELVRDGVRESWGYVKRNEREFEWQVYGRLMDQGGGGCAVRRFLESTSRHAERPWLRPKSRCFAVPGGNYVAFPFEGSVRSVAFLDKKAVVCVNGEAFIVNLESGQREKTLGERDRLRRMAEGGADISNEDQPETRTRRRGEVWSVAVSGNGRCIVSASWDGRLRVWDAESGERVGLPPCGHIGRVRCVAMSRDGQRIVSGSQDRTLRVWDVRSGECKGLLLRGHTGEVICVAMSGDGRRIVSGHEGGTLKVWDLESREYKGLLLHGHTGRATCVAMSGDGRCIVSGQEDGTLRVWDVESGDGVDEPLRGHTDKVRCVAVSEDGRRVVSGSDDTTLRVWDVGSRKGVGEPLRGHTDAVWCVTMSRDGRRIVSGSSDKTLRVWDVGSKEHVSEPLHDHTHAVECVTMSGDGRRIVSGSSDKTLRVWDAESGKCVHEPLRGHTCAVSCVVVSRDGRRIVSGSYDKTLRVWGMESGECVGEALLGHTGWVTCVAVSEDGRRIVSGSRGGTLRVWDTNSGEPVGLPRQHDGVVERIIS